MDHDDPLALSYLECHDQSMFVTKDCYFITVAVPFAITYINVKEILSESEYERLMDKKLFLIIEQTHGAHYHLADYIYSHLVLKENVPASQIILVCGSMDIKNRVDELSMEHNLDKIHLEVYYRYERENLRRFYLDWNMIVNQDTKYPKIENPFIKRNFDKNFLCFNGMYRSHRLALLTLMHNKNLQDKGYISFAKFAKDDNWNNTLQKALLEYPTIHDEIIAGSSVKETLPYILDVKNFYQDLGPIVRSSMVYYKKSYFSVITETFYKNIYPRFVTEKIIKGFMFKHPFITVSSPGTLHILKDMGYKTFDPIIDESYDTIQDDGLRLKAITNEIERLCNLTESELNDFCDKAFHITEYNYDVLSKKQTHVKTVV